ncbi:MAG: trigger factor [Pseudomonadota bacterium]
MDFKATVENLSKIEKKISVEISQEVVNSEINEAFDYIKKNFALKGFRKGRVPKGLVEKQFSKSVADDVARKIIDKTFPDAVEKNEIFVVSRPEFDYEVPQKDAIFSYSAKVEVRPEIELNEYKGIKVEIPKFDVKEQDIEMAMKRMLDEKAILKPIEEAREVIDGDHVEVEYCFLEEGKDPKPVVDTVEIVSEGEVSEFLKNIKGMKKDEEKKFSFKMGEKEYNVETKVLNIKSKELPEINDEFAKSTGKYENLEDMRIKLKEELEKSTEYIKKQLLNTKLLETLAQNNVFELPKSLVAREVEIMVKRAVASQAHSGQKFTEEEILSTERENYEKNAEKNIRTSLLLDAIAEKENIKAGEKELDEYFETQAAQMNLPVAKLKAYYSKNEMKAQILFQIKEEKTLDFLAKEAIIIEQKEEEKK